MQNIEGFVSQYKSDWVTALKKDLERRLEIVERIEEVDLRLNLAIEKSRTHSIKEIRERAQAEAQSLSSQIENLKQKIEAPDNSEAPIKH